MAVSAQRRHTILNVLPCRKCEYIAIKHSTSRLQYQELTGWIGADGNLALSGLSGLAVSLDAGNVLYLPGDGTSADVLFRLD